ncbi:MAG TPA: DUF5615 family PIN-like protein [Longimicrobiaceae bacterium]
MATGGVVILFDENLPPRLARALRELGENAYHVHDVLHPGAPDEMVLRYAGEREWCMLSSDRMILQRPHERETLKEMGVGTFFLNESIRGSCKIFRTVVRNWSDMKRVARTEAKPFLYLIRENGVLPLRKKHLG